jgi:hypothetical protein
LIFLSNKILNNQSKYQSINKIQYSIINKDKLTIHGCSDVDVISSSCSTAMRLAFHNHRTPKHDWNKRIHSFLWCVCFGDGCMKSVWIAWMISIRVDGMLLYIGLGFLSWLGEGIRVSKGPNTCLNDKWAACFRSNLKSPLKTCFPDARLTFSNARLDLRRAFGFSQTRV